MNIQTWTKRIFFGCVHVPHQDKSALKILKEFSKDFKPDEVVNLGDLITADQVSRYATDTTVSLKAEFEVAREINQELGVTHMTLGNHEERLQRPGCVQEDLRSSLDPVTNLELVKNKIAYKQYDHTRGVFKFGKLKALHGFWYNQYAARSHVEAFGCCVFVHTHRLQTHQPRHAFQKNTGFNIGCLCKLNLPYIVAQPPRGWAQAFAFGYFFKSGQFSLYTARLIGREFVINGRYYSR